MAETKLTKEMVLRTIAECSELGVDSFLKKYDEYNYRDSRRWDLIHDGNPYPPKAILGIAHKYLKGTPLNTREFYAGAMTNDHLRALGFEVLPKLGEGYFAEDLEGFSEQSANDIALRAIRIWRGQSEFRKSLLAIYEYKCAVSECEAPQVLEAAHIRPYSDKADYSLDNGIILRADIHTLFDVGLLKIDPETLTAAVSDEVEDTEYRKLHGRAVFQPKRVSHRLRKAYLLERWQSYRA